MRLISFSAISLIWCTFAFTEVQSQPIVGKEVVSVNSSPTPKSDFPIYYFKGPDSSYWFVNQNRVYSFSVKTSIWTEFKYPADLNDQFRPGYNATTNQFYLWSAGGGSLKIWNPFTGTTQALGEPYEFKTQYGHTPVMLLNPATLGLFGGYGYWEYHNTFAFFDFKTSEWNIISSHAADSTYPSSRTDVMMAFNPENNHIHLTGGFRTNSGRDDVPNERSDYINDYWIFDLNQKKWSKYDVLGSLNNFGVESIRPSIPFIQTNWGSYNPSHKQAIFLHLIGEENGKYGLLVFDERRGVAVPLSWGLDSGFRNAALLAIDYVENGHQLIAFWLPLRPAGEVATIVIKRYDLPSQEAISEQIDNAIQVYTQDRPGNDGTQLFIFSLIGLGMALGVFISIRKRVSKRHSQNKKAYVLELYYVKNPKIFIHGEDITNNIAHTTLYLLLWFYWKCLTGEEFVITDEIESRFVDESINMDYSRKRRNSIVKRFQDDLQAILYKYEGATLQLKDRIHPDDKRKREYYFSINGLKIRSDIDFFFSDVSDVNSSLGAEKISDIPKILEQYQQVWANDIRESIQSRSNRVI